VKKFVIVAALGTIAWCGGAYDPEKGTNFGPCEDHVSITQQFQGSDPGGTAPGGGDGTDGNASAESPGDGGTGGGSCGK
jgi:hypothetical protein